MTTAAAGGEAAAAAAFRLAKMARRGTTIFACYVSDRVETHISAILLTVG